MIIENMLSDRGNIVANQFIIKDENKIVFQSYKSKIAEYNKNTNELKIYEHWNYSKTTMKYFKSFINDYTIYNYNSKKQFEKEIKEDENIILMEVVENVY